MRSLRILSQKREKKYQGARIAPLSFKFKREREREKGSMGLGKNMSPDFGSIKKKTKHFYMQALSCSLIISSPKYDQ